MSVSIPSRSAAFLFNQGLLSWWPAKLPNSILNAPPLNITPWIQAGEIAVSAQCSVAPSGTGEMTPSNLYVSTEVVDGVVNTFLNVTMSAGVPGRTYTIDFQVMMSDGQDYEFQVFRQIPPGEPGQLYAPPPSSGPSAPIIWESGLQPYNVVTLSVLAVNANGTLGNPFPANAYLLYAQAREIAGHAVNIELGTTLGGSDVLGSTAIGANDGITIPLADFAKDWFEASQQLYLNSASWGSALINFTIYYQIGP